ncbi:TlpA family protein disulfide reductase [Mangrovimonas xylaniphaga]|uniref:TlpA family protein disulfide reductase n=1 Tax=Mangrovimonas xylaniphaga TaxID=1645915 RepID=UPI0009E7D536|nr:TlpA disulfide reductase family protein [Mangrovimonas xylaniphaga]
MKSIKILVLLLFVCIGCKAQEVPTTFSQAALEDTFTTLDGQEISFQQILTKYQGKTILIDVWASWCKDCLQGLPKVKSLQEQEKNVVYLFLSLDRSIESWKFALEKYGIAGEHYYMQSGRKGDFGSFANLDWIPRYMVVSPEGTISLFRAVKADDPMIIEALK